MKKKLIIVIIVVCALVSFCTGYIMTINEHQNVLGEQVSEIITVLENKSIKKVHIEDNILHVKLFYVPKDIIFGEYEESNFIIPDNELEQLKKSLNIKKIIID